MEYLEYVGKVIEELKKVLIEVNKKEIDDFVAILKQFP